MHWFVKLVRMAAVVLTCLAAVTGTRAQESGPPSGAQAEVKTLASIRLESILQLHEIELPSKFNLALRLLNASDDAVTFRAFKMLPLEEPGGLRVKDDCAQKSQFGLARQTSSIITCQVASPLFDDTLFGFLASLLSSWSLVTMQPGEYRFLATAEVRLADQSVVTVATPVSVRLRPTVWQVITGAIVGALLLALFAATSARVRVSIGLTGGSIGQRAGQLVLLWLGASVSAAMFILLTFRLKDAGAPITLTVNDFYGGIVIGVLGYFLTDWLANKVFAAARTP